MLLFGLFAAEGCKKPEDDLGLSVLDPADTLGTVRTDTVSIVAWTRTGDSVQTSALSSNEVGSYLDPQFGRVTTGTVTQLRLSVNDVGPADESLVCDSLVLSLAYSTVDPYYGTLDPQTIRVFRLNEDLTTDSIYRSNRQPVTDNVDLVQEGSSLHFTPFPVDSPLVGGVRVTPQLRIPLSTDLGKELLGLWGQPTLADNASFLAFFKGLYVVPDETGQSPSTGGIWRFNLLNGASKMTLYYHDGAGVNSSFDFIIGSSGVRYTYAKFDRSSATGITQALSDTSQGQQVTYIQAMGGLRPEIRFPYLDRYANSPYQTLAKAELIVSVANDDTASYPPPSLLYPLRKDADGIDRFLPDQDPGLGVLGGFYEAETKEYHFNMTRWVQGVINGTYANTGLAFVPGSSGISVNRAALAGPQHPDHPMKLVLTFTTY